ncbi:hypothetical protein ACFL35_03100 [Candidatus Riflebacteria bacterium]
MKSLSHRTLICLALFFLNADYLFALKCQFCERRILGKYILIKRVSLHIRCFKKLPRCDYCKNPFLKNEEKTIVGNHTYHTVCHSRIVLCGYCQKPIIAGSYFKYREKSFHEKCVKKIPLCDLCGRPITGDWIKKSGQKYHLDCHKIAIFCDKCGKRIVGQYLLDIRGQKICLDHNLKTKCFICLSPGIKLKLLSDGRKICEQCEKIALPNEKAVKKFDIVRKRLENYFGIKIKKDIAFSFVSQKKLNQILKKFKHGLRGAFVSQKLIVNRWMGLKQVKKERFKIFVISHLPGGVLESVLAHELMHAWQQENCPPQELMLKEGMAELISYLYGQIFKLKISQKISSQNMYPEYRDGLRKALFLKRKYGLNTLLEMVKKASSYSDLLVK